MFTTDSFLNAEVTYREGRVRRRRAPRPPCSRHHPEPAR